MKWGGRGVCAVVVSGALLFACAASAATVGFKCVALGARVRARFHLATAAGAFYSGILLAMGQALLCAALLCCGRRGGGGGGVTCGNFFLLGLLVFVLGVLTAFSGAVVDGDAVALVERKHARYCADASEAEAEVRDACDALRDYQRALLASAILNALECVLGLLNLLLVKRCQNARFYRRQRRRERLRGCAHSGSSGIGGGTAVGNLMVLSADERDLAAAHSPTFRTYINPILCRGGPDEGTTAEVHRGGHPSSELPGYSPSDPELNHSYPFSYPLPNESPPAYEDIFPGEAREQRARTHT
ncbi:transmembrane protein 271-like [Astyanax mexicanus]|uniref:Transmembrane protein 271-like n=1 Tax=Astyanax mexicanus TaxID=7994 RepID=A0A8T2LUU7_ASTMX|nr:transmembrane protein 271-like [Astyanax mexicanus]